MQKTSFKFEIIVHDDASTDSSPQIIMEYALKYPDIIFPIYEIENQYSKNDGSLDRIVYSACKGKYIAECEGDDYWIDPYKLQKQVDYMEENIDCVLTCHRAYKFIQKDGKLIKDDGNDCYFNNQKGIRFTAEFNYKVLWMTQTLCTMYRNSFSREFVDYPYEHTDGIKGYFYLKHGYGYCFNEYMAVYRINESGIWSRLSRIDQFRSNYILFSNLNKVENNNLTLFLKNNSYWLLFRESRGKCVFIDGISFGQLCYIIYRCISIIINKLKNISV